MFIIGESIVMGNLLATAEVTLKDDHNNDNKNDTNNDNNNAGDNIELRHISSTRANKKDASIDEPRGRAGSLRASSIDDSESDEFLVDDIDERAEEIAEDSSMSIHWYRRLQYMYHVLSHRLSSFSSRNKASSGSSNSNSSNDLLPVPFSGVQLLEVLGAVTMVCFIDDDIICESYSVAEEIFLLKSNDTVNNESEVNVKGTVLDLHANPNASGSRFENPLWWKYLPSLKPMGLSALLTYAPTKPQGQRRLEAPSSLETTLETLLVKHVRNTIPLEALRELAEEIGFIQSDISCFQRVIEINVIAPGLADTRLLEDTHAWGQEETRRRGTLVSQVRGAIVVDTRGQAKVNASTNNLNNDEDNDYQGQGLTTTMQMMTQGDPSLILNYCSEYW